MLKNEEEIESNTQINSNPILWNASKVLNWLKNTLKLEISSNIYKSFEKNEITGTIIDIPIYIYIYRSKFTVS